MSGRTADRQPTFRQRLRDATRDAHEALHVHPLLCRLQSADLTRKDLVAAASVTYEAAAMVEAERAHRGLWPQLSFASHLRVLRADLAAWNPPDTLKKTIVFRTDAELLGAVYVLKGSAFGGDMLYRRVKTVIPDVPASFFMRKDIGGWQYLCDVIETLGQTDRRRCEKGANDLFAHYHRLADDHLRGLSATADAAFGATAGRDTAVPAAL